MLVLPALQQQTFTERSHHFGTGLQMPPQQTPVGLQSESVTHAVAASALFASRKQASAIPARPIPNCLNACRRVTD